MSAKQFHRHQAVSGLSLYWIIIAYLIAGYFWPAIGLLALVCMIAPVALAFRRGRWWCGNACPRGSLYDHVLSRYSPHRPVPAFVRTAGFRLFMVAFILTVFGVRMYSAWGDWNAMGRVFWDIILVTTVAGVILAFIYAPRTWCSFCPMGTLSAWASPRAGSLPDGYRSIHVGDTCRMRCKSCARVCPMQLTPYDSRGASDGYLHPDCIKCGRCAVACPVRIMSMSRRTGREQ